MQHTNYHPPPSSSLRHPCLPTNTRTNIPDAVSASYLCIYRGSDLQCAAEGCWVANMDTRFIRKGKSRREKKVRDGGTTYIHCPCGHEARETFTSVCLHVWARVCASVRACKDDRWQGSYNLERQTRVCMAWRAARPSNKGKSKRNDKRQTLKHPHSSPPPPSATAPLFVYPTTSHPSPFLSYITRPTYH